MDAIVDGAGAIEGRLQVPGDKSIAHRALILGALAMGTQTINGLPPSADVASTAACLRALGCTVDALPDGCVAVSGAIENPSAPLDAGNSGTTARLLAGLVAGRGLDCTIVGDASLSARPMKRIAEPLGLMGAAVQTAPGGGLPLVIRGRKLKGITFHPPAASAQVKSHVLIAGLHASGVTTVVEKAPTRDHTEILLEAMGVPVVRKGLEVSVPGGAVLESVNVSIPGDISSAAFFMAAAAAVPGSEVRLENVGVNPTRTGALDVLRRMGANITLENVRSSAGEPVADIVVRSDGLKGIDISGPVIPALIDELPVLAVVAALADGTTTVRDAAELRAKESDRIRGIVTNLALLGASIEEFEDGFAVKGPCRLRGCAVDSFGDHRIAMAMAVAGLAAAGRTKILGAESVDISYPGFFIDLAGLARQADR
jgi:3-phosphoshikimate 1-carboxyvinyltransferase